MEQYFIDTLGYLNRSIDLIAMVVIPCEILLLMTVKRRVFYGDSHLNVFCALVIFLSYQLPDFIPSSRILSNLESVTPIHFEISFFSLLAHILVGDLCFYLFHRMAHTRYFFAIDHSVHHSSKEFDFSTNLRLSVWAGYYAWTPLLIPVALGFNPVLLLASFSLANAIPFFCHTQHIGKLGWVEYIFNTPSHHRVHHGCNPEYKDKNFGGMLIIWDRLLGTYAEERAPVIYGVSNLEQTHNPLKVLFGGWKLIWKPSKERHQL